MVGRTTLVVAHRLSTVRALDRLLVLDKGRVVEEGSHEQLIRIDNGVYRRLFERQALELTKGLLDDGPVRSGERLATDPSLIGGK
jgi:ATP-binding cassette, subfamily B, bacterial